LSAERVYQMAQAMQLDAGRILEGIICRRVHNSDHQILAVDDAFKICQEENVKLAVIDSILSHFRSEYIGRETLSERQQKLNAHLHKLSRLARAFNLAVVLRLSFLRRGGAYFLELRLGEYDLSMLPGV